MMMLGWHAADDGGFDQDFLLDAYVYLLVCTLAGMVLAGALNSC